VNDDNYTNDDKNVMLRMRMMGSCGSGGDEAMKL
jgi:hypothetical protein